MTEAQWFACDEPRPMLEALGKHVSTRKMRLFGCACCRRVWELLPHAWNHAAVEAAEWFADGFTSAKELAEAGRLLRDAVDVARRRIDLMTRRGTREAPDARALALAEAEFSATREAVEVTDPTLRGWWSLGLDSVRAVGCHAASGAYRAGETDRAAKDAQERAERDEKAAQAALLRDLFADRFRFVVPDHGWFTSDVMALATNIYNNRAFEHMPILADALQDAGCDSDHVLNHCRDAHQVHARGCWVIDLILGKV